jgi:hypothetical protein
MKVTSLMTFGDARSVMLDCIADVRNGKLAQGDAEAISNLADKLIKLVHAEVSAAKMSVLTAGTANDFGRVVGMGRRAIANAQEQEAS